jgi:hypothetical protein
MRLETTFLRNIKPFIHSSEGGTTIEWGKVAWVAIRDTILSPLLFGTAGALFTPLWKSFSTSVGGKAGLGGRPSREGGGISALRSWLSGITGSTSTPRKAS